MTEPEVGMCWFCHRTVPWSSLIAGYDTWDEQRLACNTCNDAIRWLNDHGHVVSRSQPHPQPPPDSRTSMKRGTRQRRRCRRAGPGRSLGRITGATTGRTHG